MEGGAGPAAAACPVPADGGCAVGDDGGGAGVAASAGAAAYVRDDPGLCEVGEGSRLPAAVPSWWWSLGKAVRNPELLARLELAAGAAPGAVRAALNKKNGDGDLPIHDALGDEATGPELIRAMLDVGGEAMLGVPGCYKYLPLHLAASASRSPAVVALLLARGPPGAARAEDDDEETPLHYAEEYNMGPAAAEIEALLRAAMQ